MGSPTRAEVQTLAETWLRTPSVFQFKSQAEQFQSPRPSTQGQGSIFVNKLIIKSA